MENTAQRQFADTMAAIMSSAVRCAIEYDENNNFLAPAIEYVCGAISADGSLAYSVDPSEEGMMVHIKPCDRDSLDPMFSTVPVLLSDILTYEAEIADDEDVFWACLDAAVALAKQKAGK